MKLLLNGKPATKDGQPPSPVVNIDDIETEAKKRLPKAAFDYYRSGATGEVTLGRNCRSFDKILIRPRVLAHDVTRRSMSTTVLGVPVSFPVCVSPTAFQRMADPNGEVANALACAAEGTIMTLSTIATTSIEDVARAAPHSPKFFQLYIYRDRTLTERLVRRAEQAGFRALVLTVDTPFMGQRYADERNRFRLPDGLRMANFDSDQQESNRINVVKGNDPSSGLTEYTNELFDQSLTWKDVEWLKSITRLPIVAKGVLTKEDATLAVEHGVQAILVSNHGGRQLDTVPATVSYLNLYPPFLLTDSQIEALIEVVEAVRGRCEIYLDGGIRRGTDIFKALALGARAVFIGRPMVYGLAYNGVDGARRVLQILRKEFDFTMALAGCSRLEHINRAMIVYAPQLLAKL